MCKYLTGILLLTGCLGVDYPGSREPNYTNYKLTATYETALGVAVDDPNHQLDPVLLDQTITNVQNCLQQFVDEPLTTEERRRDTCGFEEVAFIKPGFRVKVPSDWYVSVCSGAQLFPCDVPDASCLAKGRTPTEECPCACRAIIQDGNSIITAPNLELFPAQLTMLLTGCDQIWHGGRVQQCGMPSLVAKAVVP